MRHADHVALIRGGVAPGVWAELGSGSGAFTLALAELLGPGGRIVSLDRDTDALEAQRSAMAKRFPDSVVDYVKADLAKPLDLPPLDGILMANSLHFFTRKEELLARLLGHLRPGGRFVLVEYDADRGNHWVPHPLSYARWEALAGRVGLLGTRRLASVPSRFLGSIYSALSFASERAESA